MFFISMNDLLIKKKKKGLIENTRHDSLDIVIKHLFIQIFNSTMCYLQLKQIFRF